VLSLFAIILCFYCLFRRQLEVESPERSKSSKRKTVRADSGNAVSSPFGFLFSSTTNSNNNQPSEQEMVNISNPMLLNKSSDLTFLKIDPQNPPAGIVILIFIVCFLIFHYHFS
jgi:hypothetical protein